jgi:hypothetical protein
LTFSAACAKYDLDSDGEGLIVAGFSGDHWVRRGRVQRGQLLRFIDDDSADSRRLTSAGQT